MKKFLTVLVVLILIGACAGGYYAFDYLRAHAPNDERIAPDEFFDVTGDDVAIMYNYSLQDAKGVLQGDTVYLPVAWVTDYLNSRFYWDESGQVLIYTTPTEVLYAGLETLGSDGKNFLIDRSGDVFISLSLVKAYTDVVVDEFLNDGSRRIFINNIFGEYTTVTAKKNTVLRTGESVKQRGIVDISEGEDLRLLKEGDWIRVYSGQGYTGYLAKTDVKGQKTDVLFSSFSAPEYTSIQLDEPVLLVWHQVTKASANADISGLLSGTSGVNVVSPTWYSITDNEGNCSSFVSDEYISYVHGLGMQVWALVDNFNEELDTAKLLSDMNARRKLIDYLVSDVLAHDIDGINIDFEKISSDSSNAYAQFLRELSVSCRNNGLVLSVDDPNGDASNLHYRRDVQGEVCDYVINMGYDEHWAGGEAGPTASYPYVVNGLEICLNDVPEEKLINAVAFYTRIWTVTSEETTSRAVGLDAADEWAAGCGSEPKWLSDLQCYYYQNGNECCWMENLEAVTRKVELGRELGLAGIACWKLGLEPSGVWDVMRNSP